MSSGRASVLSLSILPLVLSACGDKPPLPPWAGDGSVDAMAGAAAIEAFSQQTLVTETVAQCSRTSPDLSQPLGNAAAAWDARNAGFVRAAGKMQAHTRAQWFRQGDQGRARWAEDERLLARLRQNVKRWAQKDLPAHEQQVWCAQMIERFDQGLFDIKDPKVVQLLRKFQD